MQCVQTMLLVSMNWVRMHVSVIWDSQEMASILVKVQCIQCVSHSGLSLSSHQMWMSVLLAVIIVILMLCVRTSLEVSHAVATLATLAVELSAVRCGVSTCVSRFLLNMVYVGCVDGQVRFMNASEPSTTMEGRVEICFDNTYGTICDDLWNEEAARVACGGIDGEQPVLRPVGKLIS